MKRHIAILFPPTKGGGVYQYTLSIAESLISYCDEFRYSVIYYSDEDKPEFFSSNKDKVSYVAISKRNFSHFRKALHFLGLILRIKLFLIKDFSNYLKDKDIDLLIIPTPFSYDIPLNIPFICSIPDYMHKYYPEFREYSFSHIFSREVVYTYYAKKAVLVAADSYQQIKDLEKFAKIKKDKIRVIYYIPPNYVYQWKDMTSNEAESILSRYNLAQRFIFFPAQFWAQKNHKRLIEAIHQIKEKHNIKVNLVLVGNSKGFYEKTYNEVMALVEKLGIKDQIIHLGYVKNIEMVALYKKAKALVAPPFQGPTTIPPLEAIALSTAVLTVNLFEVPKQVGDAGLLFNPENIEDMADKIYKIWTNEKLRQELIEKGKIKAQEMTQENYSNQWKKIINEALWKT